MQHYADVDAFLADTTRWHDEIRALRPILLDCGLDEAVKWGKPCYSHAGNNVAIVQPFKGFLALLFTKGALLDDPDGLLQEQGENTRSARRLCFTSVDDVASQREAVRGFVAQAKIVEDDGLTLPPAPELVLVEELQARLDADAALKTAFEALTPGRQREYHLFVSGAKQSATRTRRVEKHVDRILAGKGLRDR